MCAFHNMYCMYANNWVHSKMNIQLRDQLANEGHTWQLWRWDSF